MDKDKTRNQKENEPKKVVKKQVPKRNGKQDEFKKKYFEYYNDVKAFNNGTKEDW